MPVQFIVITHAETDSKNPLTQIFSDKTVANSSFVNSPLLLSQKNHLKVEHISFLVFIVTCSRKMILYFSITLWYILAVTA